MPKSNLAKALLAILLLQAASGGAARSDELGTWPQWRGPSRDGRVTVGNWPRQLKSLKQLWRVELPPSYSGPVVSEEHVYVTYTRDETYEGVRAFERKTGGQVWNAEWKGAMRVASLGRSMGSWIRATPTLADGDLLVAGMPDLLVCLDAESGSERWRADFRERYGTPLPELGFVCSPLVVDKGVYLQTADSLVKVDRETGESLWRCLERTEKGSDGMGQGSYSSPDFAVINGRPQVLVANIDAIAGVDPTDGKVLWKRVLDSYDQGCILAPTSYRNGIFTSTRASRSGFYPLAYANQQFTIGDGWKNKLVVYMSAPVVIGDYAYLHLKNGRFSCVDLRDGRIRWTSDRPYGKYCSLAWKKDRILALTDEGQLLLIDANPDRMEVLDTRKVSDAETWGHLAIAGQQIFIREKYAVAAYAWE